MGYVESEDGVTPGWIRSGLYEIEVATRRVPAKVRLTPPYDPKSERIKA
jgi:4-methylaminobutanoate oxidase (formaldehyde-forming)